MMNDQIKNKTNIDLIDLNLLKNNYILCEYNNKSKYPIQILNCYEEAKKRTLIFKRYK